METEQNRITHTARLSLTHPALGRQSIKVHILGNRKGIIYRHTHPIRTHRHELWQLGIETEFFYSFADRRLKECDVLLFMEASFGELLPRGQEHTEALAPFLSSFKHV